MSNYLDDENKFLKALEYTIIKHDGQYRIGGLPYVTHPLSVSELIMEEGYNTDYRIAGLFHDLLEDTDATEAEILELGGPDVLEAVKLLTKKKGYVMGEYIAGIKANDIAYVVKGADRLHNLRSALSADQEFRRKYILETIDWYLDFDKRIPEAVRTLVASLGGRTLADFSLIYSDIESWKL